MSTALLTIGIVAILAIAALAVWLKDRSNKRLLSLPAARSVVMKPTVNAPTREVPPPSHTGAPPHPPPPAVWKDNEYAGPDMVGAMPPPVIRRARPEPPGRAVFDDVLTRIVLARHAVRAGNHPLRADCQRAIDDGMLSYNLAVLAAQKDRIVDAFALLQRARNAAAYASTNSPPLPKSSRQG